MSPVVDQYGYLWTGSGPFLYNKSDLTTYSVLRFDTTSTATAILAVQLPDEANVRFGSIMPIDDALIQEMHMSCTPPSGHLYLRTQKLHSIFHVAIISVNNAMPDIFLLPCSN